jgi:AcrR family transcriptional regulator
MKKKPQQQRSKQMVQQLIDAAIMCIAQEGFQQTTVPKICVQANVSVGSFYQYFNDKYELYNLMLTHIVEAGLSKLSEKLKVLSAEASITEMFAVLLKEIWIFLKDEHPAYLGIVQHWHQLDFVVGIDRVERHVFGILSTYLISQGIVVPADKLQYRLFILNNTLLFTFIRAVGAPDPHFNIQQLLDELAIQCAKILLD